MAGGVGDLDQRLVVPREVAGGTTEPCHPKSACAQIVHIIEGHVLKCIYFNFKAPECLNRDDCKAKVLRFGYMDP